MHSLPLVSPLTLTFQIGHQKIGAGSCCLIPCAGQSSINLAYSSGQNSLGKYILDMQSIVFISHGIDQLTSCFLSQNSLSKDIAKQNACMAIQLKLNLVHAFLTSTSVKKIIFRTLLMQLAKKCIIVPPQYLTQNYQISASLVGFPGGSVVKNLPANAGDAGSIPGSGSSPGEGHGNPLQYSCLENPMDRGAWWATVDGIVKESDTVQQLNNNKSSLGRIFIQ